MHNKAFVITWEIPRTRTFHEAIQMDLVEPKGESAMLTAQWLSSQGTGKGGEGWRVAMKTSRRRLGHLVSQASSCGGLGCLHLPRDQMREETDRCSRLEEISQFQHIREAWLLLPNLNATEATQLLEGRLLS